ncbi:hypothetical protein HanIR_Chr16g0821001 [Helianthus annuus]|nr:hypothetical protein HanIR_Chr16g0821001 [Helianthus annuus]
MQSFFARVLLSTPSYLLFSPSSSHILTDGACVGPTVFLSQGGYNQEEGGVYRISLLQMFSGAVW